MNTALVPAFVLHSRPYRESSALVDFLTPQGRLRAVLRGARGKAGTLARPFIGLEVEFRGRHELKNVARMEPAGVAHWLEGDTLFSGLYLNELLTRLLPAEDAHPELFDLYRDSLLALAARRPLEPLLRAFEWRLLCELGYGFALDQDIHGQPVEAETFYRLQPEAGFEAVFQFQPGLFKGALLLSMAEADWSSEGALGAAKRLMRQALAPHLGGRPLVSRELFMSIKESPRG
ncbi:DNA repair protein RecO [Pseudomonas sp. ABC1]|uniref:DNA repair protein RecO n=1 Tax=Pseudomonas sp. ABC1 TaxID=2748080 RepID=UPI0015C2D99E|nr:DNA repair protein RecO [Pseudomonas sp. ABC1]QLF94506.1 DNA repair protein RecO [Pseudomonas sp. ABC1]